MSIASSQRADCDAHLLLGLCELVLKMTYGQTRQLLLWYLPSILGDLLVESHLG